MYIVHGNFLNPNGVLPNRSSYEHLGQRVGAGAGDVRFGGVESHVVDRLVELLPVRRDFLNARFAIQIPQTDATIVT